MMELPIVTVWLTEDLLDQPGNPKFKKMFFCNYCGQPLAKFTGLIYMQAPGESPQELPVAEFKCPNRHCNAVYCFMGVLPKSR